MYEVCIVCEIVIRINDRILPGEVLHGYCPKCFMEKMDEAIHEGSVYDAIIRFNGGFNGENLESGQKVQGEETESGKVQEDRCS